MNFINSDILYHKLKTINTPPLRLLNGRGILCSVVVRLNSMVSPPKTSLGELEAEVMETVWQQKESTVRSVLLKLQKKKKIAYTTIMTIMNRLYAKGLLGRRAAESGAYVYLPRQTKEKFFARVSGNLITNLLKSYGDVAVAQFIDILNGDDFKQSEEWRKKLRQII